MAFTVITVSEAIKIYEYIADITKMYVFTTNKGNQVHQYEFPIVFPPVVNSQKNMSMQLIIFETHISCAHHFGAEAESLSITQRSRDRSPTGESVPPQHLEEFG